MVSTYIFTLCIILATNCYNMNQVKRITYSSESLRAIGYCVGARPRISTATFNTIQDFGISRTRPRGCKGGRSRNNVHNVNLYVNNEPCGDFCQPIPVVISSNSHSHDNCSVHKQTASCNINISLHDNKSKDKILKVCLLNARSVCNKACDYWNTS